MKKLVTAALLLALGAAGLFNGIALVSDPSGGTLGLSVDMLPEWHTWDYRYSGMFVLVALGLAPLVCAAAVIVDVPRSRVGAGMIGLVVIGWILWQIVVLDVDAPRAQITLTAVGVILVLGAAEYLKRSDDRS
ncbi:hypothetical protein QMK17_23855 [Rhodococcus sp. G-MC3]|uniref:hypothetical protein n=1 Tax=Rhodococcus sp. G-MC3 TaxID=3046209 RepID=UPI0024B87D49|nr:hypothetical protein [Rhodococcus sp. G-MC3]MDJ0396344.1 hypothetical protein [Rhodococcus sp. G-MC3]